MEPRPSGAVSGRLIAETCDPGDSYRPATAGSDTTDDCNASGRLFKNPKNSPASLVARSNDATTFSSGSRIAYRGIAGATVGNFCSSTFSFSIDAPSVPSVYNSTRTKSFNAAAISGLGNMFAFIQWQFVHA